MDIQYFLVDQAPEPVAPFSHATAAGPWVFVTGQMPTLPGAPSAPLPEGIEAQTRQVMRNLKIVLEALALDWNNVVRVGAYLTHFEDDYAAFNRVYREYFSAGQLPARTCIGVTALAVGARVEVDLVAYRGQR